MDGIIWLANIVKTLLNVYNILITRNGDLDLAGVFTK
jgi:hypothetical protein